MSARWITPERVTWLESMGRLHDNVKRAPTDAERAHEWNAGAGVGNVEPVKLCREGGVVNQPAPARHSPSVPRSPATSSAAPLYALVGLCRSAGLPEPVAEYAFAKHIGRKWRADYCWPLHMLILECEGGLWTNGRHSRGTGAIADLEKYSEAAILGYRILYVTPQQMNDGTALDRVRRALLLAREAA